MRVWVLDQVHSLGELGADAVIAQWLDCFLRLAVAHLLTSVFISVFCRVDF